MAGWDGCVHFSHCATLVDLFSFVNQHDDKHFMSHAISRKKEKHRYQT